MSTGKQSILRIPLLLLALADLAILGSRVWPWEDAANLPGGFTTALDPAICLAVYLILIFAIAGSRSGKCSGTQDAGSWLGLLGGLILAAQIYYDSQVAAGSPTRIDTIKVAFMAGAVVLWGIAGIRGARTAKQVMMGFAAGAWAALLSSLFAATAILVLLYTAGASPEVADSYREFQKIGLGDDATANLVLALNSATGYLLLGPLAGAVAGTIFAFFGGQSSKS